MYDFPSACVRLLACVCVRISVSTCAFAGVCVHLYARLCVYMPVCIFMHTYTFLCVCACIFSRAFIACGRLSPVLVEMPFLWGRSMRRSHFCISLLHFAFESCFKLCIWLMCLTFASRFCILLLHLASNSASC